ncbi:DUF2059 domain-containing protein [Burkholderiaceae bacterium UC74_6]
MKHSLKLVAAAGLIAFSTLAAAQGTTPAAAPAAATSPAKKALIDKMLVMQQPGLEMLARELVQRPLVPLMQQAAGALQQVPADKREATAKSLDADVKKFVEESVATLKPSAVKLAPSTIGTLMDERFTEDELRTIVAWFESPASKKFATVQPDMQKALVEKMMAENGTALDAKFKTLQQTLGKTLQTAAGQAPQQSATKPAPAASKAAPAKK